MTSDICSSTRRQCIVQYKMRWLYRTFPGLVRIHFKLLLFRISILHLVNCSLFVPRIHLDKYMLNGTVDKKKERAILSHFIGIYLLCPLCLLSTNISAYIFCNPDLKGIPQDLKCKRECQEKTNNEGTIWKRNTKKFRRQENALLR